MISSYGFRTKLQLGYLTKNAMKRDILSLVGLLQHATKVVTPGQTFVSRMYRSAAWLRKLSHFTHLTSGFHADHRCFFHTSQWAQFYQWLHSALNNHYRCIWFLGLWSSIQISVDAVIGQQCGIQVWQKQCCGLNHQRVLKGTNGYAPPALSLGFIGLFWY